MRVRVVVEAADEIDEASRGVIVAHRLEDVLLGPNEFVSFGEDRRASRLDEQFGCRRDERVSRGAYNTKRCPKDCNQPQSAALSRTQPEGADHIAISGRPRAI